MKKISFLFFACIINQSLQAQNFSSLSGLTPGPQKVGFKNFHVKMKSGKDVLVNLWYPAEPGGKQMTLRDYIISTPVEPTSDSAALNEFKHITELPFLFHLDPIPIDTYNKATSIYTHAYHNAPMQKKRFPLIIAFAPADDYVVSYEYFASNGFCVASVSAEDLDAEDEHLYYVKPTAVFGEFLDYMYLQNFVDTTRIAALGHGWGIQSPFYLAMKTPRIKLLVNLDGGVFGPRSKTTLSPDYFPSNLKIPMLHIVTQRQAKEDDSLQFAALSNPRYRITINSDSVWHHDFTTYGRVAGKCWAKDLVCLLLIVLSMKYTGSLYISWKITRSILL